MVKWISLLFFVCAVLSPVLCCDWLAHYDHLSNCSLSLIKLMVSRLWSSHLEQVLEVFEEYFIGAARKMIKMTLFQSLS